MFVRPYTYTEIGWKKKKDRPVFMSFKFTEAC